VTYSLVNAVGAVFILVSLYFKFNLSAVMVEFFWLVISLMGAFLGARRTSAVASDTPDIKRPDYP
jgi:hypothetical protein